MRRFLHPAVFVGFQNNFGCNTFSPNKARALFVCPPIICIFCRIQYKIELVQLEDDLLERLANAPDDILSDVPLIEGLEATKVGMA